jgi:hypothetical protein
MYENRIIMRDACNEITREMRETAGENLFRNLEILIIGFIY